MNYDAVHEIANDDMLGEDFLHIQKPRSDEQLAAFVSGQHGTPERKWQQTVLEIQIKVDELLVAEVKQRQLERKIAAFETAKSPDADDEAQMCRLAYGQNERAILGATRELETLYEMYKSMPRYTREQIDAAEKGYWRLRIIQQSIDDLLACGRVQVGNLASLRQLGIPLETVLIEARECLTNFRKNLELCEGSSTLALPSPDTSPAAAST